MKWWPRYPGDWAADTGHLSLLEHGVYTALLDHYYAKEKPLPPEVESLYRIARARTDEEERAVRRVAAEFFPVNGDGTRRNKRADKEIQKSKSRSKSGSKGGSRRATGMTAKERSEAAKAAAQARWDR